MSGAYWTLESEIESLEIDSQDWLDRLIQIIKVALKEYPHLKEGILSDDETTKKEALKKTRYLLGEIDAEFIRLCELKKLRSDDIMMKLYQSDKLTPQECQLFLQAKATISQNSDQIFKKNTEIKQTKPKKMRLSI